MKLQTNLTKKPSVKSNCFSEDIKYTRSRVTMSAEIFEVMKGAIAANPDAAKVTQFVLFLKRSNIVVNDICRKSMECSNGS